MKQWSKPWVTRAIPKSTYDKINYIQISENKDILQNTTVTPKINILNLFKMFIFGVTVVLYFVKILSGSRKYILLSFNQSIVA